MKSLRHHTSLRNRGFPLAEMLFAIFILGIGVISIASLFPVGLTQQRRSTDAIVGPTVARHAFEVIQSKVSAEDFGWANLTSTATPFDDPPLLQTIEGDFAWHRPAFHLQSRNINDDMGNTHAISAGTIDLFAARSPDTNTELPFNPVKYGNVAPAKIITQEERYWPAQSTEMIAQNVALEQPAQYVWDCAFRRFQGRMQVAIFVYRAEVLGGQPRPYHVLANPNNALLPPMPWALVLASAWHPNFDTNDPPGTINDVFIPNTNPGDPYNPYNGDDGWQAPGAWLLDNNNNIHQVLGGRRNFLTDGPVELTRPVPAMPLIPSFSFGPNGEPTTTLWYIPPTATGTDQNNNPIEWSLTPVYIAVRELK